MNVLGGFAALGLVSVAATGWGIAAAELKLPMRLTVAGGVLIGTAVGLASAQWWLVA